MNNDRRGNGRSTRCALHKVATAIAKGLPFVESNRAQEAADETEWLPGVGLTAPEGPLLFCHESKRQEGKRWLSYTGLRHL